MLVYRTIQVAKRRVSATAVGLFDIDAPVIGSRVRPQAVEIAGWAIGVRPVVGIQVVLPDGSIHEAKYGIWRDDILRLHPDLLGSERCGFRTVFDLGSPGEVGHVAIRMALDDGSTVEVASLLFRAERFEQAEARKAIKALTEKRPVPEGGDELTSIVIPVHNNSAYTEACIDRLLERGNLNRPFEIIVVDDGSTDNTPSLLEHYGRRIRSLRLSPNHGFSRACNAGAAAAQGEFILFLNNDTLPEPGWLEALCDVFREHPRAGIVGAKLLYPDGTVQHAGVSITVDRFAHHLYAGFRSDHPAVNRPRRMRAVTGACMLVRADLFRSLGGFDTGYVNGWEDSDLCLRAGQAGWETHYCPSSVVVHFESVSRAAESPTERNNRRIWVQRWQSSVEQDQLTYMLEDGLLEIRPFPAITAMYPWQMIYDRNVFTPREFGRPPVRDQVRTRSRPSRRRYQPAHRIRAIIGREPA
jgi:GT2 family glycosyltransferase